MIGLVPEMVSLRKSGLSHRQIAAKLGIKKSTVGNHLRAAGMPTPQRLIPARERRPQVFKLSAEGMSHADIASKFGVAVSTVKDDISRIGGSAGKKWHDDIYPTLPWPDVTNVFLGTRCLPALGDEYER